MHPISIDSVRAGYSPRNLVLAKTTGEVRTFLAELANGTTNYRTVNSLTQQIEHQYHSRFVIELVQNAHDALKAQPERGAGRIEFRLVSAEGEHGVLYVANDGQPFRYRDFLAIARLGQSAKDPRESIGHKGLGFRSVLEISNAPEIYSQNSDAIDPASELFTGFNFRFAPEILAALEEFLCVENLATAAHALELCAVAIDVQGFDREAILDRVRNEEFDPRDEVQYLSPYLLPLPIDDVPAEVRTFGQRGFSTVLRLPLMSTDSTRPVIDRLSDLDFETVLFLDSLRELHVSVSSNSDRVLRRSAAAVAGSGGFRVRIGVSDSIPDREFVTWRKSFGGENLEERKRILTAVRGLPESWHHLDRAELSAAVSCTEPADGRFFIYLPTDVSTATAAHLNAPFYGDLNRARIDFTLPVNALFLEALRDWLLDEIVPTLIGRSTQEAVAVIDLLAPTGGAVPGIIEGQTARLSDLPLFLTQFDWTQARDVRPLPEFRESRYIDSNRLRNHATFKVLHPCLDSRVTSASTLITNLGGRSRPLDSELAATFESVALSQKREIDWVGFWTDVEHLLPRNAATLRGYRVLLVQDGSIVATDPEQSGLRVFFPPLRADGEGSEDQAAPTQVPSTLQGRIAFLSDRIPLRRALPNGRQERTAVRSYLQDHLVDDYGAEPILRRVVLPSLPQGEVALDSPEAVRCAEALDFAFRIIASARDRATLLPLLQDVRFPCRGGWLPARDTTFGPGWAGRDGDRLSELLNEVDTDLSRAELKHLLLPSDDPAWRGHGPSLFDWASQSDLKIATGLRLLEDENWHGRCWLQKGSTPALPSAPPGGIPADLWTRYVDDVRPQIKPAFVGMYAYDSERPLFFAGLDRLDTLSNRGLHNLTLVLFRSIPEWKSEWRNTRLTKDGGERHSISIESFLSWAVSRLPWLWSGEGLPPTSIRERWFVPAVAEPGQSHQYDHLKPISPEIVRAVQRISPSPLQVLAELGLLVLDSERQTSNTRLVQDLADALEEGEVNPTNSSVFIGQVRAAWGVFEPADRSSTPARLVVTRAGRQPESFTPTHENPVYLPDVKQRWFDSGPLAKFPVLVIRPGDANRLSRFFEDRFGTSVRRLSGIRIDAWCGNQPWSPSPDIASLEQTGIAWLVPFTLCVAVARDPRQHRQTRAFREAMVTLRSARADRVPGLRLRLRGNVDSTSAVEASAFWHDEERILLYDDTDQEWLVGLAGPLASILDRADVLKDLRLALTALKGNAGPDDDQQQEALAALDIDTDEFDEVRQACSGDLAWIVDRVLPAVTLIDSTFDSVRLAKSSSIDEVRTLIDSITGGDPPSDWLIDRARECNGDGQMGRALWERIGNSAELRVWNTVLQRLEPPRRPIENARWLEEFRNSRTSLLTPLRALLRYLCVQRGTAAEYKTLAEGLLTDPSPDGFRYSRWQVGCQEVLNAVQPVIDALGPSEAIRTALDQAQDSSDLSQRLRAVCPEIDPERDPSEYLRENLSLISRVLEAVQRTAVAYHARTQRDVGLWGDDMNSVSTSIQERLSEGDGYLTILNEQSGIRYLLAFLKESVRGQALLQGTFGEVLETSSTVENLRRSLGVTSDSLRDINDVLSSQREADRRGQRMLDVCGARLDPEDSDLASHAWRAIESIPNAAIHELDPSRPLTPGVLAKRGGRSGGGSPKGKTSPPRRISEREANLVGLLGEMFAYRILRKRFGTDSVGAGSWRSENSRAIFPGNPADDGLGYDFVIVEGRKTWYIEVKASLDDSEGFALGSSEVRAALERADGRRECYRILHVRNVRSVPKAHFLPNPFDRASKGRFDLDEAGLRIRYRVADRDKRENI